jgi:hypothetical protein
MDDRVEAFLREVLALEGKNSIDVRRGVRHHLAECEKLFQDTEADQQMKDKAAHSWRALCRARVLEEIPRHKGTRTAEHLELVLDIVDLRIRFAPRQISVSTSQRDIHKIATRYDFVGHSYDRT